MDFHCKASLATLHLVRVAGIEGVHFQDLRHTAGSRWVEKGTHANTIKELLRHCQLSTTKRYMHASADLKRAAVTALENFGQRYVKSEKVLDLKKGFK